MRKGASLSQNFTNFTKLSIRISQLFSEHKHTEIAKMLCFIAFLSSFIIAWQHYFGVSCQKYQLFCINFLLPPFLVFKCFQLSFTNVHIHTMKREQHNFRYLDTCILLANFQQHSKRRFKVFQGILQISNDVHIRLLRGI